MPDQEALKKQSQRRLLWAVAATVLLIFHVILFGIIAGKRESIAADDAYRSGYDEGKSDGYEEGFSAGRSDAIEELYDSRYDSGFSDAEYLHRNDYEEGYDAGRGKYEGSGYLDGYNAGVEDGSQSGYMDGYHDGYRWGFDDASNGKPYDDEP